MTEHLIDTLLQIPLILILIIVNGIFSMSELAVMTSRRIRLQQRAEDGDLGAQSALKLNENPNRFLSTVQIGITLVGTLSSAVASVGLSDELSGVITRLIPALALYAHQIALALIVLIITYLSLVIGELVPKRLALINPEGVAAGVARFMSFLEVIASPVARFLSISTDLVVRVIGVKKSEEPSVTEEDIRSMLQEGEEVGVFEETETDMVESIFRLGDRRVDSLMTPRTTLEWLDLYEPLDENVRRALQSTHTFFPVAEESLDNVQGILSGKELLAYSLAHPNGQTPEDFRHLITPALFVPETTPAFKVLEQMREASGHLALVIDEWGGVQGMVTLFDVLEAIVGAIPQAGQPFEPQSVQREDGSWLIDGGMNIEEFKDLLKIPVLPDEDRAGYQTVAGFVLSQLGTIPTAGQGFTFQTTRVEVLDMDGLRVDKVLVKEMHEDTGQA